METPALSESDDAAGVATPHPSTPSPPKAPPAKSKLTKRTRASSTENSPQWFNKLSLCDGLNFKRAKRPEMLHGLPVIQSSGQSFFASALLFELLRAYPNELNPTCGKFPKYECRLHTIFNGLKDWELDIREFDLPNDPHLAEWFSGNLTEFLIRKYGSATLLLDFLAYKRDIEPSSMPSIDTSDDAPSPVRKLARKSIPTPNNDSSEDERTTKPTQSTTTATKSSTRPTK